MESRPGRRHSFVVRIWWEEGPQWRGWVQHAGSGEETYIQSLRDLLAFIQRRTGRLRGPTRNPRTLRGRKGG